MTQPIIDAVVKKVRASAPVRPSQFCDDAAAATVDLSAIQWAHPLLHSGFAHHDLEFSHKMTFMFTMVQMVPAPIPCAPPPSCSLLARQALRAFEKVVVCSQSAKTLGLIEYHLCQPMVRSRAFRPTPMRPGLDYYRVDPTTRRESCKAMCAEFNDENTSVAMMLVDTRARRLDLSGADRAIFFDAAWDPAEDHRAVGWLYRLGRTRPLAVYRLVSAGTLEERMCDTSLMKRGFFERGEEDDPAHRAQREEKTVAMFVHEPSVHTPVLSILGSPAMREDERLRQGWLELDQPGWLGVPYYHDSIAEPVVPAPLLPDEIQIAELEYRELRLRTPSLWPDATLSSGGSSGSISAGSAPAASTTAEPPDSPGQASSLPSCARGQSPASVPSGAFPLPLGTAGAATSWPDADARSPCDGPPGLDL